MAANAGFFIDKKKATALEKLTEIENMVQINPGNFIMSIVNESSDKRNSVRIFITRSFHLDAHEVTNKEYRICVQADGCEDSFLDGNPAFNGDDQPVAGVSHSDAEQYCRFVGKRLPTEAEWEYAARGGRTTRYWWGDSENDGQLYENFRRTGKNDKWDGPAPVKSFKANPFGLFDILGNMSEHVADYYTDDVDFFKQNRTNPFSNKKPSKLPCNIQEPHSVRGASWFEKTNASHLRRMSTIYGNIATKKSICDEHSFHTSNYFRKLLHKRAYFTRTDTPDFFAYYADFDPYKYDQTLDKCIENTYSNDDVIKSICTSYKKDLSTCTLMAKNRGGGLSQFSENDRYLFCEVSAFNILENEAKTELSSFLLLSANGGVGEKRIGSFYKPWQNYLHEGTRSVGFRCAK